MAFSKQGLKEIQIKLERLRGLPQVADQELKAIAIEVKQTAKDMAPIDYGGLKKSIKIRRTGAQDSKTGRFVKGKSNYTVYIDNNTPTQGRKEKTVGEYAWFIHEHMGWGANKNVIMPSKKSIASGNGKDEVGGKFLDRAIFKYRTITNARLNKVIKDFVNQKR